MFKMPWLTIKSIKGKDIQKAYVVVITANDNGICITLDH